jgi:hypothetical protein
LEVGPAGQKKGKGDAAARQERKRSKLRLVSTSLGAGIMLSSSCRDNTHNIILQATDRTFKGLEKKKKGKRDNGCSKRQKEDDE